MSPTVTLIQKKGSKDSRTRKRCNRQSRTRTSEEKRQSRNRLRPSTRPQPRGTRGRHIAKKGTRKSILRKPRCKGYIRILFFFQEEWGNSEFDVNNPKKLLLYKLWNCGITFVLSPPRLRPSFRFNLLRAADMCMLFSASVTGITPPPGPLTWLMHFTFRQII